MKKISPGNIALIMLLLCTAVASYGQAVSNSGIDQLSHHTEEWISPLKGEVLEIVQTSTADFRGNFVMNYDHRGQLKAVEERKKDQGFYRKIKYEYDGRGRRTHGKAYSARDAHLVTWEYTYDGSSRPMEMYYDGKLSETYTYDAMGRLFQVETKNYNQTVTTTTGLYSYNDKGQIEELKVYLDGVLVADCYYAYYENGDINYFRKSKVQSGTANEYTFTYEYDEMGNWVKRSIELYFIDNDKPDEMKLIRTSDYQCTIIYRQEGR